jgi:hypothetical protein
MPKKPKAKEKPMKDPIAVALAAKRMDKLTPGKRRQIARTAAAARWGKAKAGKPKKA